MQTEMPLCLKGSMILAWINSHILNIFKPMSQVIKNLKPRNIMKKQNKTWNYI